MNRPDSLDRTLKYMTLGNDVPEQVVIIDQSEQLDVRKENESVLRSYEPDFGNVVYQYQNTPSLTKARNYGYTFATNEIIVFSDDDVDVRKDTFSNIASLFSNDSLAMAGGVNEGEEDAPASTMSSIFGMASIRKRNIGHMSRACYGRFPSTCGDQTPTEWAMGFFFAVRKSLMNRWSIRFDEKLKSYAYAEDLDFTYGYYLKAKAEKLHCVMSRQLIVKHNVSKEYRIPKRSHIFMTVLHRYYISHKYSLPCYELNNLWSNIGLYLLKLSKKERPSDLFDAQLFYYKYCNDILQGQFHSEKWQ